jgi:hypothetical protein
MSRQETAAAIKVQRNFRRNKAMNDLEAQGMSTVAIRNRTRRRRAREGILGGLGNGDLFSCCGVGLAFCGDSGEESEAARKLQKEEYFDRRKAKAEYEDTVRATFRKKHLEKRGRGGDDVEEALEVVE